MKLKSSLLLAGLAAVATSASAATINISSDINTSTTWTSDNVYQLNGQIYVTDGATLTIEAGTVVASVVAQQGSLAVTRGSQIFINGTASDPVIMTSEDDVATWDVDGSHPTGGDPATGTLRKSANEWGNLTIMGSGVVSGSSFDDLPVIIEVDDDGISGGSTTSRQNSAVPDGLNQRVMEGLTAQFPGDDRVLYGGNNDNDDSGSINYLSLRYTGRVIGLGNELNGLSLGGIGRGTDIQYVEVMNNVDDGIEIWGGAVELKYVNIWNIGDDSFDVDQGWRGKAQFGLIVQGYSLDANQGSGVGDNVFEFDGAEDADAQPVTTAVLYNFTAIGQPLDGDGMTTWRDNARVQYRNCLFMDGGEALIKFDDDDGDGGNGYSGDKSGSRDNVPVDGTLNWEDHWTTAFDQYPTVNAADGSSSFTVAPGDFNSSITLYQSQVDGNISEISDSVFFRFTNGSAFTESDALGVTVAGDDAPAFNNVVAVNGDGLPIRSLTRAALFTSAQGKDLLEVTEIDPLIADGTAGDILRTSAGAAPSDGFFTAANYRGAFNTTNWLAGWTAADAFGLVTDSTPASVNSWETFEK